MSRPDEPSSVPPEDPAATPATPMAALRPPEPLGATLYWRLVGAALFALIPMDLLSTGLAVRAVGVSYEANPLARWALTQGFHVYLLAKLLTGAVVFGLFVALGRLTARLPGRTRRWFTRLMTAYLLCLLAVGLVVFLNNMAVVLVGESLLRV
jgi:hypothetical protein